MPPILYVDATSGGMILQVLLSGFVGGAVIIKLFWANLTSAIFRRGGQQDEAAAEGVEESGAPVS